ncbi:MAG: exo-alpha-sialidase, partial [Nitrospinae bacterium]|nr:exo-alpha-sialidase [Nitrospinota bacterium]
SSDDGKTFSEKVRVNSDSDMPSGINHAPSMSIGAKGELYVAWAGASGNGFASDIKFSRSLDGGRTFEPSITVNDDKVPASHGFESMTIAPDGTIYLAWLDRREKKEGTSATYFARSFDSGKTFEKNVRIDVNSCPCCRTAVTSAPDGTVYVSWRKVFNPVPADSKQGGDVREIVAAKSSDRGISFSESSIVGNDNWVIAGCPHRGASLSADKDGILYIVWYTEGGDGLPSIYIANSKDGGKNFTKNPLPYSKGTFPDHPVMALNKDGIPVILWEETTPVLSRVMFQLKDEKPQQMNQGIRRSHDPVISVNKKGDILVVWSQEEMRFTKTALRLFRGQ